MMESVMMVEGAKGAQLTEFELDDAQDARNAGNSFCTQQRPIVEPYIS
jgi:hypothetical protein